MMWFNSPYGMGGWILIAIGGLLVLIIFIGLIIWAVSKGRSPTGMRYEEETPEEVLKRRYAKGEISQKEYKEMLSEIKK